MANLKRFIGHLSQDANLQAQYLKDPDATLSKAGLSAMEREAVLSGDRARIASLIDPNRSTNVLLILGVS